MPDVIPQVGTVSKLHDDTQVGKAILVHPNEGVEEPGDPGASQLPACTVEVSTQ